MEAIAHNPGFAKKAGVPQSVGRDFTEADKGRKFSKGGATMATKMNSGFMAMMAKKKAGAKPEMPMKKMATGGFVRSADGVASKGKTKAKQIKMKSGGMAC